MMIRGLFFPGVGPIPEMAAFDITVVDFTAPPANLIFDAVAFYGARFLSVQLPPVVLTIYAWAYVGSLARSAQLQAWCLAAFFPVPQASAHAIACRTIWMLRPHV